MFDFYRQSVFHCIHYNHLQTPATEQALAAVPGTLPNNHRGSIKPTVYEAGLTGHRDFDKISFVSQVHSGDLWVINLSLLFFCLSSFSRWLVTCARQMKTNEKFSDEVSFFMISEI